MATLTCETRPAGSGTNRGAVAPSIMTMMYVAPNCDTVFQIHFHKTSLMRDLKKVPVNRPSTFPYCIGLLFSNWACLYCQCYVFIFMPQINRRHVLKGPFVNISASRVKRTILVGGMLVI